MTRSRLMILLGGLAMMGAGCAHCDTCDDIPVPCSGPNCGARLNVVGQPPAMIIPGTMVDGPAPVAPAAAANPGGSMPVPALPAVPADSTSPPAGPAPTPPPAGNP